MKLTPKARPNMVMTARKLVIRGQEKDAWCVTATDPEFSNGAPFSVCFCLGGHSTPRDAWACSFVAYHLKAYDGVEGFSVGPPAYQEVETYGIAEDEAGLPSPMTTPAVIVVGTPLHIEEGPAPELPVAPSPKESTSPSKLTTWWRRVFSSKEEAENG